MKVAVTGADGFLGWHLRTRLAALTDHQVVAVPQADWPVLAERLAGCDAVVHLAGVNVSSEGEANVRLAHELVTAASTLERFPRIVYSNSIQAGNGTPYGDGKAGAAEVIGQAASAHGAPFVNVLLPNLFGEHGRPNYNSFTATFVHKVLAGEEPTVSDKPINLLHAQGASQALMDGLAGDARETHPEGTPTSVQGVLDQLLSFNESYAARGEIPPLEDRLSIDLFNTFRAGMFPDRYPIPLKRNEDNRGVFVEIVRAGRGEGQTSYSTTVPGVTRGNHFHLRKIERFVVVSGQARISLRRSQTSEVVSFDVSGQDPCVVDMPTMWSHNITNTGSEELVTMFWINELYDPADPDTFPEQVELTDTHGGSR